MLFDKNFLKMAIFALLDGISYDRTRFRNITKDYKKLQGVHKINGDCMGLQRNSLNYRDYTLLNRIILEKNHVSLMRAELFFEKIDFQ